MYLFEKYTKEELQEMCDSSETLTDFCKKMGYSGGSGYKAAKNAIDRYNLVVHFKTLENIENGHSANFCQIDFNKFKKDSNSKNSSVRKNLIQLRGYRCEVCGLSEWNGQILPLQVHHINGIRSDNRLENLQILCPNCHSLTENFAGKNKNSNTKKVSDEELINALKTSYSIREAAIKVGLSDGVSGNYNRCYRLMAKNNIQLLRHEPNTNYCCDCGKPIDPKATRCVDCYKQKKAEESKIPDKEVLLNDICAMPISRVGKKYDVSDSTVRKWCKKYGLPFKKKDIEDFRNTMLP